MRYGQCVVVQDELTLDMLSEFDNNQRNTTTQNSREGEESAFQKALRGSKIYLRTQGFLSETEGDT